MEWLDKLRDSKVGLDTAPLIYFIEENPNYIDMVNPFFEAAERGEFEIVTSTVTLLEVLVHPLRQGRNDLVRQYRELLVGSTDVSTVPVSSRIGEAAARLRATYNLDTPDAIQMATAITEGASFFLTNDARLSLLQELEVLVLSNL